MEVFPPDEAQPNDVGSGPTVPHERMKDWDENFASLEIALQNPCESKDGHSDGDNSKEKELPFMKESHVKNEGKRKWDDGIDDSQHKLKRMNDILLGTGDVTIHLVNSKDEKSDSIPVSNLLTIMKSETKSEPDEFKYMTPDKVSSQLGSVDFNKTSIKKENELDIKDLKDFTVEIKPAQVKPETMLDDKSYLTDSKDFSIDNNFPTDERKHSISENKFMPDNKNFPSDSEMTVSKDIKSDSGFTDDLSTESKADLFSPDDDMMYDIKNSDELGDFKSDIDSECALSSNMSRPHSDNGAGLSVEDSENHACDNSNLNEAEESSEKKDKDKKDESGEKSSKKDDKLSKKKKFERCNIRDIKLEDELDAVTLSAQKEEQERIRRLQEAQMRALQERLQQIEVEKEALSQLFSQPPDDGSNIFDSSISDSEAAKDSTKTAIKTENDVVLLESSDDDKKANLQTIIPPPVEENIIDISSSSSGNESDSEDSDKKDDDVMVLSDEGETEEGTAEDPNNSGAHTNDCFNLLDEEGRVLVNVGHPPEDPDIFLAPQIAKVIKPHQIGGIRFLYDNVVENIERYKSSSGFGCILAHSMGLGKTVQVVSFVDVFLRHIPAKLVLCIVPINTIQNWKAEFDMWVPAKSCVDEVQSSEEIRPRTYHVFTLNENFKTMAARAALIAEWRKLGGVLLMGYEMYRMLALRKMPKIPLKKSKRLKKQELVEPETNEQIKKYMDEMYEHIVIPGPDLVICDEGHRIKNSLASTSMALKSIKTRRRVVLTGYPLQNNLLEYWCMVDFVRPNYLGSRAEFCNMFERPISNGQCIDSTPRDRQLMRFRSHVLHSLLVGFVQRRGHSVLRAVLPKKEEHVLLIRMTPIQRQLYKCFVKDLLYVQQATNPLKLFAVCCKIWNHPDILYKLLQEKKAQEDIDLDIDIATNSGLSGPGGKKRATSQSKSKLMQRPLRALPRSLKPQPCITNSVEGTLKPENIKCEQETSSNTAVACKDEFSYGQTNVTDQKDFQDSQSYQSQYSKSNTSQQGCQRSYPGSSGQFNPSTQYLSSSNSPGSSQTPYSSQTSIPSGSQYPHSMQQYSQSSSQYSQVNSQYGGQANPQEDSSSHPSSPTQTSFQTKPSQSFAPQSNTLPYTQQTDQYQQKSGQTMFPKQPTGQEMNFPQSPSSKFSSQTSQQYPQSFSSQNSSQYPQSYPPTSKQHQYSEQSQTLQFSSPMSENIQNSHSTSQSYSNPQSHISEQTSSHFQPTHFSQKQSTQQFSQPATSSSSQFSSSEVFPHISPSDHFPQQSSSQQSSTPSQPSSSQQSFPQLYPQQTSEFSSSQHFEQQSFSEQTSPNQGHYSHQGYTQQYLSSDQQYNDQTSQQFSQQSFSSHQSYSNQAAEGSKYGTKQSNAFPPQSPSNLQFSSQKQGSNSSEEGNQTFNPPTFSSHKTSESQYSQAAGSSLPFGSPSSQNSQTTNQFSPHEVSTSDQYIQISSNSQYNQSINSTQSFNQPSSQQFSGCGNQVSPQFNQPQSSQQFGQPLNSPQYSQPAINSCFSQQPMSTQQFSSPSSKGKQYPQSTQGQNFPQPSKAHFSQSSPTQKSYSQQISSQSCPQQPQFSQPQQYSLQSTQQYNQTQPPHSPQQFSEKSPQQYNQPSSSLSQTSSQSSQLFLTHQQFSQQGGQSSQDFNQPTSEPFNKQISPPYNARQSTEQFNQLPGQPPLNQTNQPQQYSPQQNQSSQIYKHQVNTSSQGYKQPSPPQFNPSQYSQKQIQNSQQYSQQFSQPVQSPQQFSQQPSPQQFSQQPSPQQFSQPAQSPQQYSQPSPQQFPQQTSPSPQQFSQTSSPHQYPSQPTQQFPQQPSPQQYSQPSQTQASFSQQVGSSQQQSPQQFPLLSQSQAFSQPANTSPQQYTQQTSTSPQQYTQPANTSPQQYTQQANASTQQFNTQTNAPTQQFIQQTNTPGQQFSQQTNASAQQFNQTNASTQQFNQQTTPTQQFNPQTNSSTQQFNQQANASTQQFNQPPSGGNQQFNPQTNASTQQFNQQTNASNQQYNQQTNASTQQFNQQLQSFSHSSNSQQFNQQSCQQFSPSSQSYSQNNPSQFSQQPSPQQFTQPPQSQQTFNQANTSQQLSPQQFTKPSQSQQSFNPQTNPQQFSQQPSPQQVQQSQQSFSQQKVPAQDLTNQTSSQGSQPSQQFKHQGLHSSQSAQFSNPQVFSGSFPQPPNTDALKESFQAEYSNQSQSSVTNQGLSSSTINQQGSKFTVRGAKAKQARGKSICQSLPPSSGKQTPFSVQSFQNGSPNPSPLAMGQQAMKQLQNSSATFQPNSSMTHENYSLQPTKQESGMFTSKCSKSLIGKPDSTSSHQMVIKPEQSQTDNDQNSAETTVMPFRDKADSSISYEWAIPLMKEYVLGVLENSHKMMVLFVIIAETLRMGDKLLVFSQSLSTLDLLEHFLVKIQVPTKTDQPDTFPTEFWSRNKNYFRLDGSTSAQEREKLINEFNRNENVSLFLLSTRAGCLGINLVGANRIVVMDASWNPCHDAQAVCRIYRYGQKKQCHIYRLVTDNSLEKRIYDRQVNKQGMSDRVVDELNPESNFTWKDVTTLIQDDEDDGPVQELSKFSSSYTDKVLKYLVSEMSPSLSKEPFEHESLLLDRKDLKLTKQEKRLAKQSYEMAKRANMINIRTTYTYLPANTPGGGQIIINNKQCQWVGGTTIRVLPNQTPTTGSNVRAGTTATPITASPSLMSSLFKQGVMVQKLTMPSNVSIPVLTPGAPPVVIPAGQDVLVLRTPKGVYLRLPDGRIIAVQLPPSLLAKTQFRPNVVTHFRPTAPKGGNQPTTVISTPRGQSIGIIKQTLQCGGTVRYGASRGAAGTTASNSSRCAAPEVIDLSDDDEPSLRKSGTASNASTNSSESDTGSLDQDKLDSMQPVKFPGKQITIRKISPSSPQNSSGSNSKEKCEIPQVLSKNKQITIMPINPTSQQNRQKVAPQLAQPVRVQQMLLQPQQGKRRPIQKNMSKVSLSQIVQGKNVRSPITITQPNLIQQSQSVRPVATHNQPKEELLDTAGDSDKSSVAKQSEDPSSLNTEVSCSLNTQNVPQALQNAKNISISLSESPKSSTLPDSLASLTNKLNPNLQISPVEHFPVSQANTLTSGMKSVTSDLLPQKNIFHQNTSLQAVSSSSFQSQNVQSSHPVCKSPQLSNKSDSSVQQLNVTQSVYNLKPTPQAQTHYPTSQTSSSASSGSTLEQSFQHAGIAHTNTPQMQPKIHSEQFTSLGHSRNTPRPSSIAPRNQPAPRKRKSTNKPPPKKSTLEPSVVTQGHPLVPDATQQFRHPENHFSNFPHSLAGSDFQVFPTFSSQKPVPQIQHPQPLLPLQHSQEHNAHLQHMSHLYPLPSHIPSAPSSLTDMQAPRSWLQPSVSSFLPFSQSSSMYSQESSQFSFPPSFPPSSVASNSSQSESNANSGSGENKASHLSSSDL